LQTRSMITTVSHKYLRSIHDSNGVWEVPEAGAASWQLSCSPVKHILQASLNGPFWRISQHVDYT
jgi:hypothetical protein